MKFTKEKLVEMFVLALLSAGIAFLQNLIAHLSGNSELGSNPEVAGGVAIAIRAIRS